MTAVRPGEPARAGDSAADEFAAWVEPHVPAMTRLAARLVAAADRDDVVQEAMVNAWRKRHTFDDRRGTPAGWLLGIVANCARRHRTRAPRDVPMMLPDGVVAPVESDLDLERALAGLPKREQLAVDLFYFVGLDIAGTAEVMGVSAGTVKATLHHARARLRDLLEGAR